MHHTCPNPKCASHGCRGLGNVIRHGFARLKCGKPLTFRQIFTLATRGQAFFVLVVFEYQRPLGPALKAVA